MAIACIVAVGMSRCSGPSRERMMTRATPVQSPRGNGISANGSAEQLFTFAAREERYALAASALHSTSRAQRFDSRLQPGLRRGKLSNLIAAGMTTQ